MNLIYRTACLGLIVGFVSCSDKSKEITESDMKSSWLEDTEVLEDSNEVGDFNESNEGLSEVEVVEEHSEPVNLENRPLFDGTYKGWYIVTAGTKPELGKKIFSIENGKVHVFNDSWPDEIDLDHKKGPTRAMMITKKSYEKFHLKFEYKWGKRKANNFDGWQYNAGVYYHITKPKIYPSGIEYQLHYLPEENRTRSGDMIRPAGQNYDWYFNPKNNQYLHPSEGGVLYTGQESYDVNDWRHTAVITDDAHGLNDKWNKCEIIAMGSQYAIHKLNGKVVNMAFNINPGSGQIGLQAETAEVYYRNIEIKEFAETFPAEDFLK